VFLSANPYVISQVEQFPQFEGSKLGIADRVFLDLDLQALALPQHLALDS
jgi:hypothetical protein